LTTTLLTLIALAGPALAADVKIKLLAGEGPAGQVVVAQQAGAGSGGPITGRPAPGGVGHHFHNTTEEMFVIFDGEEYIYVTEGGMRDRYFIGSEHFAKTWRQSKNRSDYSAAILLDMIAGKDLKLPFEIN